MYSGVYNHRLNYSLYEIRGTNLLLRRKTIRKREFEFYNHSLMFLEVKNISFSFRFNSVQCPSKSISFIMYKFEFDQSNRS